MKRLRICTALVLLINSMAMACGPWYYNAADYRLYRIVPATVQPTPWQSASKTFAEQNLCLWAKQTSFTDTAAIRRAVYNGTLADWEWLYGKGDDAQAWFKHNGFVKRLQDRADTEAIGLLYRSKQYECLRNQMRSPWYYNSRVTDQNKQMQALCAEVQTIAPHRYDSRTLFLLIKSAWATQCDSLVVATWQGHKGVLKGTPFYLEAEDYVARSLERLGRHAEADHIYLKHGVDRALLDTASLRRYPNSGNYARLLQDRLEAAEWYAYCYKPNVQQLLDLAQYALAMPAVKDKAMWRYAAACCLDFLDRPAEALAMLQSGNGGTAAQRRAARMLILYLRGRTDAVDDAYLQYTTHEVQWLVRQVWHEYHRLPKERRAEYAKYYSLNDWESVHELNQCNAFASLQRIVLDEEYGIAHRLAANGYYVRALQMANVADNYIIDLASCTYIKQTRLPNGWVNYHDYSNGLFQLADRLTAHELEHYRQRMLHPVDSLDVWFNARSYTNGDYWQDIIGTHYLRERNYSAAVAHLRYVSPGYQRCMNMRFAIDPFSIDRTHPSYDSTHYKLHFAQRMDSLQRAMLHNPNADSRGLAMLEYTIGLQNSYGMCWWLTTYGKSKWGDEDFASVLLPSPEAVCTVVNRPYKQRADAVVEQLRSKALLTLRTDDARARYHARLEQLKTVMEKYTNTSTAQHYALVCDTWSQYRSTPNLVDQPTHLVAQNSK